MINVCKQEFSKTKLGFHFTQCMNLSELKQQYETDANIVLNLHKVDMLSTIAFVYINNTLQVFASHLENDLFPQEEEVHHLIDYFEDT